MNFIKKLYGLLRLEISQVKVINVLEMVIFKKRLNIMKKLSSAENDESRVIIFEFIARTPARLENYKLSLIEAKKCLSILITIKPSSEVLNETKARITLLIKALENKDKESINELITI